MTMGSGDSRSCYDEKQALEKARRRLRLVEDKIKTVQRWTQAARHEIEQFDGQLSTLGNYMDNDIPRAIAALQRMHASLIKYVSSAEPGPRPTMQSDNIGSSDTTSSGATASDNVTPEFPAPDAKRQPPLAGDDSIEECS
jgi:hypothetical protein